MIGINIEMPKCCYMCNFFINSQENGILDKTKLPLSFRCCADLNIKRITSEVELTNRHKECPLIEIKEKQNDKKSRRNGMTTICKYCYHWQNGRCQKTKYNTDMLTGKGKWLGIKTSWNHCCRSGDFTQRKGETE